MPSKRDYDLVGNDESDPRVPLHPDEAFHRGITFQAKYIGTVEVPKPSSRLEIVAAMRRIRYEFKSKGIKKKKVVIEVSVEGVRVILRKKKKSKDWPTEPQTGGVERNLILLEHPIYRIFYVSHDSQDLKIFSYIARDTGNIFKCSVFKSTKKSQAMRVVRTVGQAFEVSHKLSGSSVEDLKEKRDGSSVPDSFSYDATSATGLGADQNGGGGGGGSSSTLEAASDDVTPPPHHHLRLDFSPHHHHQQGRRAPVSVEAGGTQLPASGQHELQLAREQLDQQVQQTQAALSQVHLLRDQLAAETAARIDAQTRIHGLLVQNKELLDHISSLVQHLQEQERQNQLTPVTPLPQAGLGLDGGGPIFFPADLGGSGYLLGGSGLGGSYYSLGGGGGYDYLRGLRSFYGPGGGGPPLYPGAAGRGGVASFPNTPLMSHRSSATDLPPPQTPTAAAPQSQDPAPPFILPLDPTASRDFSSLRISDQRKRLPSNGPFIQRSTSEKVPNRSELMSEVQRTAWARHTTK